MAQEGAVLGPSAEVTELLGAERDARRADRAWSHRHRRAPQGPWSLACSGEQRGQPQGQEDWKQNCRAETPWHWPRTSGIHLFPCGTEHLEPKWLRK
eukprot:2697884-Pyramimonas_sp.AAC.1